MPNSRPELRPTVVVEDDHTLRSVICAALEDAGFHPVECVDLAGAREAITRVNPTVLVLDLMLEGEFGGALLEELSVAQEAPAVVICSAFPLATLVAARYGVPCVGKPFELDTLVDTVSRASRESLRPQAIRGT